MAYPYEIPHVPGLVNRTNDAILVENDTGWKRSVADGGLGKPSIVFCRPYDKTKTLEVVAEWQNRGSGVGRWWIVSQYPGTAYDNWFYSENYMLYRILNEDGRIRWENDAI